MFQVTEECLERGIAVCKDGASFKKIGKRIRYFIYSHFVLWVLTEIGILNTQALLVK